MASKVLGLRSEIAQRLERVHHGEAELGPGEVRGLLGRAYGALRQLGPDEVQELSLYAEIFAHYRFVKQELPILNRDTRFMLRTAASRNPMMRLKIRLIAEFHRASQ